MLFETDLCDKDVDLSLQYIIVGLFRWEKLILFVLEISGTLFTHRGIFLQN